MPCTISLSDRSGREFIPNHEQGLSRESVVPGEVGTADTSKNSCYGLNDRSKRRIPTGDLNMGTLRESERRKTRLVLGEILFGWERACELEVVNQLLDFSVLRKNSVWSISDT